MDARARRAGRGRAFSVAEIQLKRAAARSKTRARPGSRRARSPRARAITALQIAGNNVTFFFYGPPTPFFGLFAKHKN